jgi:hypothetical protein
MAEIRASIKYNILYATWNIKWVEQVQDGFKWKAIVEKVKTLPEL